MKTEHCAKILPLIYLLAFAGGFLSLSLEVIWVRMVSFAAHSVPQAFSYTLALFLLGIAVGAQRGKAICSRGQKEVTPALIGKYFFLAACIDVVAMYGVYLVMTGKFIDRFWLMWAMSAAIVVSASVRGIVFPLVHHLGTQKSKSGRQISNVYFSNVLGSSIAPIFISFVVLDYLNTQQIYLAVCLLTFALVMLCTLNKKIWISSAVFAVVLACSIFMLPERIFYTLSKDNIGENIYPVELIENKHGFIQVYHHDDIDSVWGSNVYDGQFNTDLIKNSNGINRAYLLPVVKPDAKNILIIGLSTGSWARVLTMMPDAEKITIVEINPDYVGLIEKHPEVAPLPDDARVEIVIDDGRRWLRRHDGQFDIILMNTTWHWRAYASNLLSQEFLTMVQRHLSPDGVLLYNTTHSPDAYFTAQSVFPQVYQYMNMVLASHQAVDFPEDSAAEEILARLRYPESGQPVFAGRAAQQAAWAKIRTFPLKPYAQMTFDRSPEVITDNNMITEYKYGRGL